MCQGERVQEGYTNTLHHCLLLCLFLTAPKYLLSGFSLELVLFTTVVGKYCWGAQPLPQEHISLKTATVHDKLRGTQHWNLCFMCVGGSLTLSKRSTGAECHMGEGCGPVCAAVG